MATSKQPKQPPFPHPPLEVGVPQYPTPNVPDFYTKSGHIILVEKVSVEKGSYKPLPLDGTAVYQGRDANKWPSNLYLVAERPTEDGEYAYRYWANDRTLASQNPWNYGVDYSQNSAGFPIYSRTYIVPRSQYAAVNNGSTDPMFGGSAIVASQRMRELPDDNPLRSRHVQVEVVYESIPGPLLGGEQNSAGLLGVKTTSESTVPAGTHADSLSQSILSSEVSPIDAVKSKKTTVYSSGPKELDGLANKPGLLGNSSINEYIVAYGASADSLSFNDNGTLSSAIISSEVTPIDSYKSKKRTEISSGPFSLSGKKYGSGLLGEVTIGESIVSASASPDSLTTTIISSEVTPIDSSKSKKTTITASGPSSLTGFSNESGLLGQTSIFESIVTPVTSADALSQSIVSSQVTPIDRGKSKKTNRVSGGPFTLQGASNEPGLLGNTTTTEQIVAPLTDPDALSLTLVSSQVTPIDAGKSKKTNKTSSGPIAFSGFKLGEFGPLSIGESIVAAGDSLSASGVGAGSGGIESEEVVQIDSAKSKHSILKYDSKVTLGGVQYDSYLDSTIIIQKTLIATSSTINSSDAGTSISSGIVLDVEVNPIDYIKSVQITKILKKLPNARTEYYSGNYTNPNLVVDMNADHTTYNGAPVSIVKPTIYRGRTYHTNFSKYIEFIYSTDGSGLNKNPSGSPVGGAYTIHPGFTPEANFSPFSPQEIHLYYSGNIISFDYGMCLIDGTGGFLSESPIYCYDITTTDGSIKEIYFNGQHSTNPSASQYLAYNNNYVPIGQKVSYWKSNIWVRETEFVLIQVSGPPSS